MMSPSDIFRRFMESDEAQVADRMAATYQPAIPLGRAALCLDCEVIYEATGRRTCPACGSSAAWSIGHALNRSEDEPLTDGAQGKDDQPEPSAASPRRSVN